jgi:hypothetical protein
MSKTLNNKIKRQIEWHFKNYKADKAMGENYVRDVAESGMVRGYDRVSVDGGMFCNAIESKIILMEERSIPYRWAKVVENTLNAYRFDLGFDMFYERYMSSEKPGDRLLMAKYCVPERTYYRWIRKVLETAFEWAKEFNLL